VSHEKDGTLLDPTRLFAAFRRPSPCAWCFDHHPRIDFENIKRWTVDHGRAFDIDHDELSRAFSELNWVIGNAQIAVGQRVIAMDDPELNLGLARAERVVAHLRITLADFLFCYYVGVAWEAIYRVWGRVARAINLVMLGQERRAYFDRALDELAASIPELTELPSFRALRKSIKRWTRVAGSRNDLSHVAGSVFSYLNVEFRADKDADGNPHTTGAAQTMWLRRTAEVDGTTLFGLFRISARTS